MSLALLMAIVVSFALIINLKKPKGLQQGNANSNVTEPNREQSNGTQSNGTHTNGMQSSGSLPFFLGINCFAFGGYSKQCLESLLGKQGKQTLNLRNISSSFLNPSSAFFYEKDLFDFLKKHGDRVELYTCLFRDDLNDPPRQDAEALNQLTSLKYLQINSDNGDNPTESNICDTDPVKYLQWIRKVDAIILNRSVVFVIPFRSYWSMPAQCPGNVSAWHKSCVETIMNGCASIQGRQFAISTTIYQFWTRRILKPSLSHLKAEIDEWLNIKNSCVRKYGFAELGLVICEIGWPSHVNSSCAGLAQQAASHSNAESFWRILTQEYSPPENDMRIYYWQFFDKDNGDNCGETWGLINKDCSMKYV